MIVGHGSKLRGFQSDMTQVARALQKDKAFHSVVCAYLEITSPSIPQAIEQLIEKGAQEIRVLPYFLLKGRHTQEDIPKIIQEVSHAHKGHVKIKLCRYLSYDPRILALAKQRISEA